MLEARSEHFRTRASRRGAFFSPSFPGDRLLDREQTFLELAIGRAAGEFQEIPGTGLAETLQCPASVADGSEDLGIVTPRIGTGVLDQPCEPVAVPRGVEVNSRGVG